MTKHMEKNKYYITIQDVGFSFEQWKIMAILIATSFMIGVILPPIMYILINRIC